MIEPRLFTVIRNQDPVGISGTGRILDGVIFHTGQVVVCWRSDINPEKPGYSSVAIYPSWDAFLHIHVRSHPKGAADIRFSSATSFAGGP